MANNQHVQVAVIGSGSSGADFVIMVMRNRRFPPRGAGIHSSFLRPAEAAAARCGLPASMEVTA